MAPSASASRRRGGGRCVHLAWIVVALLTLAAAPAVRAEPDPASAPTSDAAAGPQGNAAAAPGDAESPGNSASAPAHAADSPGNAANAPGHAADSPGNSAAAPGHTGEEKDKDDKQAKNDGAAGGTAGETGEAPRAETDQGTSIGQKADASASAAQEGVGNTHTAVRVDEPGNGQAVGQENRAEAGADASASAGAGTEAPSGAHQDVQAGASASQSGVSNTTVIVRVGSPGDDAGVTQTNVASSTATSGSDGGPSSAEDAQATATQEGAANANVSIRIFSPGDDGPVSQSNEASAAAQTSGSARPGEAVADQDGVRNTTVSIRVESPGTAAQVAQVNKAKAEVTPTQGGSGDGVAVAVSSDALNTVVAVAVGAADLDRPGPTGLQIWVWEWVWEGDESESIQGLIGADMSSWMWTWDSEGKAKGRGTVTSRVAGDDDRDRQGGSWDWKWDWNRQGVANWTWQWDWQGSLGCGSCVWIWNWSWNWTGQPADSASTNRLGASGDATPGQLNTARADAEAVATARVDQSATQDGSGAGTQFAGQLIQVQQVAEAVADAYQTDVVSLTWGHDQLRQSNIVVGNATVVLDATLAQDVDQLLATGGGAIGDQWSGQEIELQQFGAVDATASQHDAVLTGTGAHGAFGTADADAAVACRPARHPGRVCQRRDALPVGRPAHARRAGRQRRLDRRPGGHAPLEARRRHGHGHLLGGGAPARDAEGGSDGRPRCRDGVAVGRAARLCRAGRIRVGDDHATGGAALPLASSEADAANRAAVVQEGSQRADGSAALDLQELLQQSIVVQKAVAVSTSNGGIAGIATVVNCAVTQQGAAQSIGAGPGVTPAADLTTFCFPATPSPRAAESPTSAPTASDPGAPTASMAPVVAAIGSPATADDDPAIFHGGRAVAASPCPVRSISVSADGKIAAFAALGESGAG